jgi:hypothetical protein
MPYRDDVNALNARRDELASSLEGAQIRANNALMAQREESKLSRELADVEALLEKMNAAKPKRVLPMLEDVRVASPCSANWDAMTGDDRVRHCGSCNKSVFNLSAMNRSEAEALLQSVNESICVRLYRRADGTVMTADCPVGAKKKRRRKIFATAIGGSAMAMATAAAWMTSTKSGSEVAMGAMPIATIASPIATIALPIMGSAIQAIPPEEATPPTDKGHVSTTMGAMPPLRTLPNDQAPKTMPHMMGKRAPLDSKATTDLR